MRYVVYDFETDGLLDTISRIHMLQLGDLETGAVLGFTDDPRREWMHDYGGTLADGMEILKASELRVSFNGHAYDEIVMERFFGVTDADFRGYHLDLRTHGSTIRPYDKLLAFDSKLAAQGKLPKHMKGSESLKAWAIRAGGALKGDLVGGRKAKDSWLSLTADMWTYGIQDVPATMSVYHWMMQSKFRVPWMTMWIEQETARMMGRLMSNGWTFDEGKARELSVKISEDLHVAEKEMMDTFGSWYRVETAKTDALLVQGPKGNWKAWLKSEVPVRFLSAPGYTSWSVKLPKRSMIRRAVTIVQAGLETELRFAYTEGAPYTPVEVHDFSPSSRRDIYLALNRKYGWEPKERTDGGGPKVDDETLMKAGYPEAIVVARYLKRAKIASYVDAWMKAVKADGRIYHTVLSNRAVTRRMTHRSPNLAQVPASGVEYGKECRSLFLASPGYDAGGADASQLELVCLGNRLAPYDGGTYAETLRSGDVHVLHISMASGLSSDEITKEIRNGGKSVTYGWLYGAGNGELKATYSEVPGLPRRSGKAIRAGLETGITGAGDLLEDLSGALMEHGYLNSLDGWRLWSRSEHSRLNLQLQSDGALIMKVALILADELLRDAGVIEGKHWRLLGAIHDEYQWEALPDYNEAVGQAIVCGIRKAGDWFGFAAEVDGQYKTGASWKDTH